MKKILITLFLFIVILAKGQNTPPTGVNFKALTTYSLKYYVTTGELWIYKGSTYGWTKMSSKYVTDSLLNIMEFDANKVTSLSGSSTDIQYPSAKLVYDQLVLKVPTSRTITATAPITIAGTTSADLSANRTIAIIPATTSVAGSMSAADKTKLDGISSTPISGTQNYVSKFTSASAIGNSLIYDNGTNIGINTASPLNLVDIKIATNKHLGIRNSLAGFTSIGTFNDAGNAYVALDIDGLELHLNKNSSGKVGIGTSTPATLLDVNGTGNFASTLTASSFIKAGGTSAQYLLADGSVTTVSGSVYKGEVDGDDGVPRAGGSVLIDGTGTAGWYYACYDAGTWDYAADGSGNSIVLAIGDQIYYNGTIWIKIPGAGSYTLPIATATLGGVITNGNVSVNAGTGGMTVLTNADLTGVITSSGNATSFAASPTFTGTTTTPSLIVEDLTDGYIPYQKAADDKLSNSNIFYDGTNIGIGTTTPSQKLEIIAGNTQALNFKYSSAYGNSSLGFIFDSGTDEGNKMQFNVNDAAGTANTKMTVLGNGNVGIGTATPATTLDVNGTGTFATALISPLFNGLAITNNGTNTLTITAGKTFTSLHTLTLDGTDGTTFTFPHASANVLTDHDPVTTPQGGTGLTTLTDEAVVIGQGVGSPSFVAPGTSGYVLTSNGTSWTSAASVAANYEHTGEVTGATALTIVPMTSAAFAGKITNETGTGLVVFATSPVLTTPALGTPSACVATNLTGTATALNIGGTAAKATILATTRAIYGNNFDGSAALTQIITSTYGGTGNGFTKFTGPTTAEKTFTLPNANETFPAHGASGNVMTSNGTIWTSQAPATSGTVTSVAALTLGTTGTDLSSTVANGTTTPVITLQVPTASATNRGALSAANWSTFNGKQAALNGTGFVKISGTTISYDNSTYLTTSAAASTYVPYSGATGNVNLGAHIITADNFQLSDRRLKDNITCIKHLSRFREIEFVQFNLKTEPKKLRFGVIAQDLEKIAPELVYTDEKGIKAVNYIELLIAKIADLENRVKELEKANDRQVKRDFWFYKKCKRNEK